LRAPAASDLISAFGGLSPHVEAPSKDQAVRKAAVSTTATNASAAIKDISHIIFVLSPGVGMSVA
jgi:NAD/NADP transhydrogenase beta subunit